MLTPGGGLVPGGRGPGPQEHRGRRSQGAGKTTLVRALCAEIDPLRRSAPSRPSTSCTCTSCRAAPDRARLGGPPGSGERGPDGRQAGEFTLDEALVDSFRFNLSRQIVGEVRGQEIWAMIKAMESGAGSISTTHASDAEAAIRKLVTCAMEAGAHVTHELATSKLAATIDLVVQLDTAHHHDGDGTSQRRPLGRGDHRGRLRASGRRGTRPPTSSRPTRTATAVPAVLPDEYRALAALRLRPGRLSDASSEVTIMTRSSPLWPAPWSSPA